MNVRCLVGLLAVGLGCSHAAEPEQLLDGPGNALPPVRPWDFAMTTATSQPPLTGATLLVTADGASAVVSDPDHARIVVVDLAQHSVRGEIALGPDDEPGRAAEDDAGRVFVALRRGGALVTVDPAAARITERRAVCAQPRGVAYDADRDRVLVACAEGALLALPTTGDGAVTRMALDDDLRDVAARGNRIYVSRFRSADVLVLDPAGAVVQRFPSNGARTVAWRMVLAPTGEVVLLHQQASAATVSLGNDGYSGGGSFNDAGCGGAIVTAALSVIDPARSSTQTTSLGGNSLSIDVALSASGADVLVASPGNWGRGNAPPWLSMSRDVAGQAQCVRVLPPAADVSLLGQVIAAAPLPGGGMLVQTRAPAAVVFTADLATIALGGSDEADTGHRMFHTNPEGSMTCASCHPEGGDDGHVWDFEGIGPRRTPMLRGGMLGTEPFHWNGDLHDFGHLVDEVLARRMGAPRPSPEQSAHLSHWVDAMPALRAPAADVASSAAARGRALFASADVGCASCHGGPHLTNNQTVDVGTGGSFQVPSLTGLRWRAPYMHNGCAPTLRDRFGACGGDARHGHTASLAPAQIDDLVAYLETL